MAWPGAGSCTLAVRQHVFVRAEQREIFGSARPCGVHGRVASLARAPRGRGPDCRWVPAQRARAPLVCGSGACRLGVRPGHVGLSCVTEITRMVLFARVTPLNPTWTGPNAPHALKSAFRATHTTSHSACVAARGTDRRHPGAPARHGARGPPAGANVSEPHRRERCDPSRMKVKRLDLRYSLIGVVGTAPLEHGELHRSAKVVGAGLLRFLLLKALLSLD